MNTPDWALTLAYWLHMVATVIWIGGLAAISLFILPAARKTLPERELADFLKQVGHSLDRWGWFSLVVLLATGMFQMSASPKYEGFLAFSNRWALAILIKHIVFLVMVGISVYLTWFLLPGIARLALRQVHLRETGQPSALDEELQVIQRRELFLLRLNLVMGVIVLALTSIARSA